MTGVYTLRGKSLAGTDQRRAWMVRIGNHMKMSISLDLRARTRDFYGDRLGCKSLASPRPTSNYANLRAASC